jgi:S-adenosylmethionine-diacylglycerol 3-amino-3-carboxypropyl transferase
MKPSAEIATKADFSRIRYAQVWEDADILTEALAVGPDDDVLSIASAGDNVLSLAAAGPRRVVAVDLSPAQLACLALRIAAFRTLDHGDILGLVGSRSSASRTALYRACRSALDPASREFWDDRPRVIESGIGAGGKFESYFRLFREFALPLVHSQATVGRLLGHREPAERAAFYDRTWNTWRWRAMFRVFFSRTVMGALGRDPSFFRFVEGSVADRILARTQHALAVLDPSENPYLHWILTGTHGEALPHYLREENFAAVRANLDAIVPRLGAIESALDGAFTKFNLSDVFEYLPPDAGRELMRRLLDAAAPGARMAYWNMLAPRRGAEWMPEKLMPLGDLAADLFARDRAFFYSAFLVEEVR